MSAKLSLLHKRSPGFTMIELLVFLAIIATFLVFLLGIILSILRSRDVSGQRELVRRGVTDALAEMSQTIRTSTAAAVQEQPDTDVLTVTGESGEEIEYFVQNQQLIKNGELILNAGIRVTELQVERVNPAVAVPLLKVSLTVSSISMPDIQAHQETYVSLRYVKNNPEP